MEKNTAWAIGLSTLVLVGFFFMQTYMAPKNNVQPAQNSSENSVVASENTLAAENSDSPAVNDIFNGGIIASAEKNESEINPVIENEKIKVVFTNKGGDIISYQLKEHNDTKTNQFVEMAENISETNRAFSVALGNQNSPVLNDFFEVREIDENTIGFFKNYLIKNNDGTTGEFTLAKLYTFNPDDYVFKLDITIEGGENFQGLNISDSAYTIRTSPQIGPFYDSKVDRYENRQFVSFNGEKAKKIVLGTNQFKDYEKEWTWACIAGKYFEIIAFPTDAGAFNTSVYYSSKSETEGRTNAQAFITRKPVERTTNDTFYFYVGPRNEKELKIYDVAENNSWNLSGTNFDESLQTSGILNWLEIILKFLLEMVNKFARNWGVSIIIVTILLKLAMFPLTAKTAKGTVKMQELQPKMAAIQEKYKDNPQKLNEQTAKLYQEIGYNPLSGCLPMLFQFVILFAMYNLFNNYFEFRGAVFIPGWISDLSVGDSLYTLNFNIPLLGNQLRLLPVIYVVIQILFSVITQNGGTTTATNGMNMKFMTYGMPVLFFFLFYNAPSGLLLYWTVSNIFQIVQQLIINKTIKKTTDSKSIKLAKTEKATKKK